MFIKIKDKKQKKKGFSLIFAVIILSVMLGATLLISDIVMRTLSSVRKATYSETAYYAAETAAEKTLFQINKNYTNISNTESNIEAINGTIGNTTDDGATYHLESITPSYFTSDTLPPLNDGESYELDLNLNGVSYSDFSIAGSGTVILIKMQLQSGVPVIIEQTEQNFEDSILISLDSDYLYKIKILNNTGGSVQYTIPNSIIKLIKITTSGHYQGTERKLETTLLKAYKIE